MSSRASGKKREVPEEPSLNPYPEVFKLGWIGKRLQIGRRKPVISRRKPLSYNSLHNPKGMTMNDKVRYMILLLVFLIVFLGSIWMIPRFTQLQTNPSEDVWLEEAKRIWMKKGLLNMSTAELQITSTALQIEVSRLLYEKITATLLTPMWALGGIIAGSALTFTVDQVFLRRKRAWPLRRA